MNAITSAEDRAPNAHLARVDRFAELTELSFADLLSLEDDLSEGSQWSLIVGTGDMFMSALWALTGEGASSERGRFIAELYRRLKEREVLAKATGSAS